MPYAFRVGSLVLLCILSVGIGLFFVAPWIKTPALIAELTDWVSLYPDNNLAGLLFFNYHGTSAANRQAVYDQLEKFDTGAV